VFSFLFSDCKDTGYKYNCEGRFQLTLSGIRQSFYHVEMGIDYLIPSPFLLDQKGSKKSSSLEALPATPFQKAACRSCQ
jgi:hypothetical protein